MVVPRAANIEPQAHHGTLLHFVRDMHLLGEETAERMDKVKVTAKERSGDRGRDGWDGALCTGRRKRRRYQTQRLRTRYAKVDGGSANLKHPFMLPTVEQTKVHL